MNVPLEWSGTIGRVVSLGRERIKCTIGDNEVDATLGQASAEMSGLDLDDLSERLEAKVRVSLREELDLLFRGHVVHLQRREAVKLRGVETVQQEAAAFASKLAALHSAQETLSEEARANREVCSTLREGLEANARVMHANMRALQARADAILAKLSVPAQ